MTNSPIFDQLSLLSLSGFRSPNLVMTQYGTLQPPVMISAGHVALWIGRTSHEFVMTIQHTYPPWNPAIPHGETNAVRDCRVPRRVCVLDGHDKLVRSATNPERDVASTDHDGGLQCAILSHDEIGRAETRERQERELVKNGGIGHDGRRVSGFHAEGNKKLRRSQTIIPRQTEFDVITRR